MQQEQIELIELEERLNITFTESDKNEYQKLGEQLYTVSDHKGVPVIVPQVPERGFLEKQLSQSQETALGDYLVKHYAELAVELQDKLAAIPVEECNEKMVSVQKLFSVHNTPLSVSTLPFHDACGEWGGKPRVFWTRETVAGCILAAGQALENLGVILHLEDGFRPVGVQEGLFARRVQLILQQNPQWVDNWDKVWTEARSKTAICPIMAGHKSGAAIDITLRNRSDNTPLPLGNKYPEGGPKVALHYPYVTQQEWSTRQLFNLTMEMTGLRTYPYENWHASYGDLSAGIAEFSSSEVTPDYTAIYGPLKGFDDNTGEIIPYSKDEYFTQFFTREELIS